ALDLGGPLPGDVLVLELTYGLPEGGAELQAARPATAVPSHDGDIGVVFNRMTAVSAPAPQAPRPPPGRPRRASWPRSMSGALARVASAGGRRPTWPRRRTSAWSSGRRSRTSRSRC